MGMLKKLIELLDNALLSVDWDGNDYPDTDKAAEILIANGVTIPVRCKDCVWYENGKSYDAYCNHPTDGMNYSAEDDFCSYGERGDNNG